MEKLISVSSDDCKQLLKDFHMSHSLEMISFDLMDCMFLFELIIYQEESDAKDFMKVLQHSNARHYKIPKSTGN